MSRLLEGATCCTETKAIRDWSYSAREFAGARHCLIGDAAFIIDPLFSIGVHLAVYGAYIASAYVVTCLTNPGLSDLARNAFDRMYRTQYEHFHALAKLFYGGNTNRESYFWRTRQITGENWLDDRTAFVRAVSGQAPAGYERSFLSRVELPNNFQDGIADIESHRVRMSRLVQDRTVMDMPVQLAESHRLIRDVVLYDGVFGEGWCIDRNGTDQLPVSEFVALVLDRLQHGRSGRDVATALVNQGAGEQTEDLVRTTIELLLRDGVLTTRDV